MKNSDGELNIGSLFDETQPVYEFKGKPMSQAAPPAPPKMSWPAPPPPPPPQSGGSGLQCPVCQRHLSWVTNERQLNLHIDECLTKQFLEHEQPAAKPAAAVPPQPPVRSAGRKQLTDSDLARQLAEELRAEDEALVAATAAQEPAQPRLPNPVPPSQPWVRSSSPSSSPFAVKCPYPGCGMPNMEAFMFPQHVVMWHTSAIAHNHACPVCALDASLPPFTPNAKTNLMQHVRSIHAEMLTAMQPLPMPQPFQPAGNPPVGFSGFFSPNPPPNPNPNPPAFPPFNPNPPQNPHGFWVPPGGISPGQPAPKNPLVHFGVQPMAKMAPAPPPPPKRVPDPPPHPPPVARVAAPVANPAAPQFIENTLTADVPSQECMICMEEFRKAQVTIRIECLCMYHKTCIHAWWAKGRRDCPLHKTE